MSSCRGQNSGQLLDNDSSSPLPSSLQPCTGPFRPIVSYPLASIPPSPLEIQTCPGPTRQTGSLTIDGSVRWRYSATHTRSDRLRLVTVGRWMTDASSESSCHTDGNGTGITCRIFTPGGHTANGLRSQVIVNGINRHFIMLSTTQVNKIGVGRNTYSQSKDGNVSTTCRLYFHTSIPNILQKLPGKINGIRRSETFFGGGGGVNTENFGSRSPQVRSGQVRSPGQVK